MTLKTTLLFIFGGLILSSAQVGINSTSPQSTLDIVASNVTTPANNDGLLIPRINQFPATNPTATQNAMLVYLNIADGSDLPGFYYWNNATTDWIPFTSANNDWSLIGNAGTNESTNFVGTTNGQGLTFRTNNTARFRIDNGNQVHALARGTQNRPFYSWDEDIDTGLWLTNTDQLSFGAGNLEFIRLTEAGQDEMTLNENSNNIDFRIESDQFDDLLFTDASTSQVSVGNRIPLFGIDTFQSYAYFVGDHAVNGYAVSGVGVYGQDATDGFGVEGVANTTGIGVTGAANSTGIVTIIPGTGGSFSGIDIGVLALSEDNNTPGVLASSAGSPLSSFGANEGVVGNGSFSGTTGIGQGVNAIGVLGHNTSPAGLAAVFANGDLTSLGVKAFTIDHPTDPENKMLKHFSIESDEVLNVYRGTTTFDANGKATIELPEYFASINTNYSYQLTAVGAAMPNIYVSKEVSNNTFEVSGGLSGKKVSWTIFAERNDKYVQQNPNKVKNEVEKTGSLKGKYLDHKSWNQPESKAYFKLKTHDSKKSTPKHSVKKSENLASHK